MSGFLGSFTHLLIALLTFAQIWRVKQTGAIFRQA